MKFKVGDRVVIVKGSEEHGIPVGTICEVFDAEDSHEFPYELLNLCNSKVYSESVTEYEIEFATED